MQDGRILTVGAAATDLDIFLTAGSSGPAINASGITFRIFDPTGTEAVTETSGNFLELGRYNASGAIIPTGYPVGENWQIKWDVVLPGGASGQFVENFCVALPSLAAAFASSDGNSVESLFDRVRIDIGDPDGKIYSNGFLSRTLKKAVARVNRALGLVQVVEQSNFIFLIAFNSSRRTPTISLDLRLGTITPDTDPYADILVLQMEQILLQGESIALGRLNSGTAGVYGSGLVGTDTDGVSATNADGVTISVSPNRLQHRRESFKFNLEQINKQLEEAIKDFRWRIAGGTMRDVSMPRYWHGTRYRNW